MRSYYKGVARDQYGAIIGGATIAIYLAGTTTVASVYTVSTGGTAVNSVTADIEGVFYFYVDTSDYSNIQLFKLVISYLGNTATYDNISAFYYDNYYIDALGEYGSGTAYTQSTIEAALTAIGTTNKATMLLRPGTWAVTADLTIPANVTLKIPAGAVLSIATGKTLTINGSFEAGLYQVFDCVGTGKVLFGAGSVTEVYPEWWGVDGIADEVQINQALLAFNNVKLGAKTYYTAGSIVLNGITGKSLRGCGQEHTFIELVPATGSVIDTSAAETYFVVLEDFHVVGGEYGLRLGGTPSFAFSKITNVNVKDASVMGVFLQHLVLVIFTNCRFSNCTTDVGSAWSNVNTTVTFIGCHFVWATTAGASILGDVDFIFIECAFEGNFGYGVYLSGCIGFKFLNCWWEGNNGSFGKAGLYIDGYPSDVDKTTKLCTFENCIMDEPSGTATHSIYINRGINNVFRDCKFYGTDFTKYIFCEEGAGGTYIQGNVLQNHYPVRQYDLQMIDCFTNKYQMLIIEYEFDGKYYSNRCNNGMTTVSFCYDFAIHGGGSSALFKIPLGAQITKAFYNVVDALTSDGASKITFGVSGDDTSGLLVTTNYNDAAFTVGYHNFIPDGDVANWTNITTAARYVMMAVATANLTAGKILIHMEYIS